MPAIICDFDGVIADREHLANTVLAEHVRRVGLPTTTEQSLNQYLGLRWAEVMGLIEAEIGRSVLDSF